MKKSLLTGLGSILLYCLTAAQYAPGAGLAGSTALHRDSSIFVSWAISCGLDLGYIKISDTTLTYDGSNLPTLGRDSSALGYADGLVVSLGDGGTATLEFTEPVYNAEGPDFAVFENGFPAVEAPFLYFLELGFVEVSSDGVHFVRFPAYSETQTATQVAAFDQMDPEKVHNLAGKYEVFYGTPFDLEDVADSAGIDVSHITQIRIRDVVGSIYSGWSTHDAAGNPVNDPWPTPFNSCGFDLDAVGIIHSGDPGVALQDQRQAREMTIYPNPLHSGGTLHVYGLSAEEIPEFLSASIFNSSGSVIYREIIHNQQDIEITIPTGYTPGVYFLHLRSDKINRIKPFCIISNR